MLDSLYLSITLELTVGLIGLLISVKIIGKRQVQQITSFDFISAILLGELLGNAVFDDEATTFHVLYAIAIWTLLLYLIEKITQKNRKARGIIEGTPRFIIRKGLVDYNVLKKENLDFTELLSMLRMNNAFSIRHIDYAIIEPTGDITIIKKSDYEQVTRSDLNLKSQPSPLNLPLIIDGEIDYGNLRALGHNKKWLDHNLEYLNVKNIKDVVYAEWNIIDGFHIQRYGDEPNQT